MISIQIRENTSFEDIQGWRSNITGPILFQIYKSSSFVLLAETLIPALLDELRSRSISIALKLEFELPETSKLPDILRSLAGYSLVYGADTAVDSKGENILQRLLTQLWVDQALTSRGAVGDGKKLTLLCREPDSPVPLILRTDEKTTLPSRLDFQTVLRNLGQHIGVAGNFRTFGGRFLDSANENQIATFLYEAFRNVQYHVRPERNGIWGVIVEKVILSSYEDIDRQSKIPNLATEYLRTTWNTKIGNRPLFLVAISVADYGPGIQNTLMKTDAESDEDTLVRAFNRGVSRKAASGSPNWGQGLANILDVSKRLNAFLHVYSAGFTLTRNTSSSTDEWIRGRPENRETQRGTAISIMWPIKDEHADQEWLPLFK